jgi:hypothetical protein
VGPALPVLEEDMARPRAIKATVDQMYRAVQGMIDAGGECSQVTVGMHFIPTLDRVKAKSAIEEWERHEGVTIEQLKTRKPVEPLVDWIWVDRPRNSF